MEKNELMVILLITLIFLLIAFGMSAFRLKARVEKLEEIAGVSTAIENKNDGTKTKKYERIPSPLPWILVR